MVYRSKGVNELVLEKKVKNLFLFYLEYNLLYLEYGLYIFLELPLQKHLTVEILFTVMKSCLHFMAGKENKHKSPPSLPNIQCSSALHIN